MLLRFWLVFLPTVDWCFLQRLAGSSGGIGSRSYVVGVYLYT